MLIRARILLPIDAPPLADGGLLVRDGRIVAAGPWSDVSSLGGKNDEIIDPGEVVLMPGLVNAHAHLEYSGMAGKLDGKGGFAAWIQQINALRTGTAPPQIAEDWHAGAQMLLSSGTTTVADMQTAAVATARFNKETRLRVHPYIEMTGVISRRSPFDLLAEADMLLELSPEPGGYAPHAPYSTMPELLVETAHRSKSLQRRVSIHVAESEEELEMFTQRTGALYELISNLGRPMRDCDGRTPVQHLARCGMLDGKIILAHANYLTEEDLDLLASSQASVVHCPGSHEFFGHRQFPYHELREKGLNLCLGTDSLASMSTSGGEPARLNMFDEMRRFREQFPEVASGEILAMATLNGARALGVEAGCLNAGSRADFILIRHTGALETAADDLCAEGGRIEACYLGGGKVFQE